MLNKLQREALAKEQAEDAARAREAAAIARRIGMPVEASRAATYWENLDAGRDPLATSDPFTHKNVPRGSRYLPIACRLSGGAEECDVLLRALAGLADEMRIRWKITLGKGSAPGAKGELSFNAIVKKSEMPAFRDAAERLAGKFRAYLNLYYAGSAGPWGADISRTYYYHD